MASWTFSTHMYYELLELHMHVLASSSTAVTTTSVLLMSYQILNT